jgi:hypothetical protein
MNITGKTPEDEFLRQYLISPEKVVADDDDRDENGDDPWLRQFLAGAKRREERARSAGIGCLISLALVFLLIVVLASGPGRGLK